MRRRIFAGAAGGLIILAAVVFVFTGGRKEEENITCKETRVEYGTLTAGITKSGSVDIGTVEQTFDLDMSALQRVDTGKDTEKTTGTQGFGNGGGMPGAMEMSGGGLNLFGQMLGGSGNLTGTRDDLSLTVAGVLVSVCYLFRLWNRL